VHCLGDCLLDPSQPSCMNYTLDPSVALKDLSSLCNMMKRMPGCTVWRLCLQTPDDPNCNPFKTLKLICDGPMGGMGDCSHYTSLCSNTSVVMECKMAVLPVPDGTTLLDDIKTMCEMPMNGCDQCGNTSGTCDTLTVYSELCMAMPDMLTCDAWHGLCKIVPTWTICAGVPGAAIPAMRMYFHYGILDYVLFQTWVPQTPVQYGFTVFGIFVFAILYEAVKALRAILEFKWRARLQKQYADTEQQNLLKTDEDVTRDFTAPCDFSVDLPRSLLRGLELVFSYFLMLVAMTFNVGLFLSIIGGAIVGTFIFGRFQFPINRNQNATVNDESSCH